MELRSFIYRHIVGTGVAPSRQQLADVVGAGVDAQLRDLHDAHVIVLDDRPQRLGEIRMALPFAAEPTDFQVTTETGSWWANCAWDSLAVVAAIQQDARIDSTWSDSDEVATLHVVDGELTETEGHIHFLVPARQWWHDIVRT
jgi:hypothetical protein